MRALWVLGLVACGRGRFDSQVDAGPAVGTADVRSSDAGDITSGLLFALPLEAIAGNTVAADVGGAGWTPSNGDIVVVPGRVGNGFHFDGTQYSSYVLFPAIAAPCAEPPRLTGNLTVTAWVRFDSLHDWNGYSLGDFAVAQGSSGGSQGAWGLGATNACGPFTAGFELSFGDQRATRCGTTVLAGDQWYHLVGVYDAAARTADIYLDGVLDSGTFAPGSSVVGGASDPSPVCPYLGSTANQNQLLVGTLDEARIYGRALTAGDIAALYATY